MTNEAAKKQELQTPTFTASSCCGKLETEIYRLVALN